MKSLQSRRVFWAKHIEQWQASGLTQVAYCQLHSLKTKAFGYRVRIHERASDTLTLVPVKVSKPIGTTEVLLRHANGCVWLSQRRLHQGSFVWPSQCDKTFTLTQAQWQWLVTGVDWQRLEARPIHPWQV